MDAPCYGCQRQAEDDVRPWLLITGESPPYGRATRGIPRAYLLCPDCENNHAHLADELHDLIGRRLEENSERNIRKALHGWPVSPMTKTSRRRWPV
jgi:hypothetical protein